MKQYIITLSVVLLMSMAGVGAIAPSPKNDPVSTYLMVEDLPTTKRVTHVMSFAEKLMIGCEDGLFIQGDKGWKSALPFPHTVYQHLYVSGGYAYVLINKSKSNFRADLFWYRSVDGLTWELCGKPVLHQVIAYDGKRNITYKASKEVYYKSTLTSSVGGGESQLHDDKRLARINSIAVQSSSGRLIVGTHQELYLSKDQGKSFEPLNARLEVPAFKGGHIYQLFVNDKYMLVQVDSYRLFLSKDSGEHWEELTAKGVLKNPKGKWHLNQICMLNGSRLVVRKNSDYLVMDLHDDTSMRIQLPRYYRYAAFAIHDDMLYAATKPPFEAVMKNLGGKSRKRVAPLLTLSLKPLPLCRLLVGNQKPKTIKWRGSSPLLVDNDSIYVNEEQFLWNRLSGKKLLDKRMIGQYLAKGSKGHWFLRSAQVQKLTGKGFDNYILMRSKDKGKSWHDTATRMSQPRHSVFDDSLEVSYASYGRALLRCDWRNNHTTQHYFEQDEGLIVKLHVDEDSRLWVLTTQGLFMSVPEGWERIPLPFKTHDKIALTHFALMANHIVINYDGRIYFSSIDHIGDKWETHTLCDPCDDDQELRFKLVGNSDQLLVLQEQQYGHIWLLNPNTDQKQRLYFPRESGLIRKAYIRANQQLLIGTTGVPIIPDGNRNTSRLMRFAALLSYDIHLKTTHHGNR